MPEPAAERNSNASDAASYALGVKQQLTRQISDKFSPFFPGADYVMPAGAGDSVCPRIPINPGRRRIFAVAVGWPFQVRFRSCPVPQNSFLGRTDFVPGRLRKIVVQCKVICGTAY
jgi:hypothetical protein